MPLKLDKIDVDIIRSLMEDGRKSFRQVSREVGVSTPTVKSRYERLVSAGLIRAIVPDLDLGKLEPGRKAGLGRKGGGKENRGLIGRGALVKVSCEYCKGPVHESPIILKVGTSSRFFCCTSCRSLYREKYKDRLGKNR